MTDDPADDVDRLLAQADRALYAAKGGGGNRYAVHPGLHGAQRRGQRPLTCGPAAIRLDRIAACGPPPTFSLRSLPHLSHRS